MRTLDYEAIYSLREPPPYEPWPICGAFLNAVATGQTALVFDTEAKIPAHVKAYR